jgi:hypothetical protein
MLALFEHIRNQKVQKCQINSIALRELFSEIVDSDENIRTASLGDRFRRQIRANC